MIKKWVKDCIVISKDFLMWTIFLKVFVKLVTVLFLFYVCFLARGMWDLSSPTTMKPAPPALEGDVLTTVSPKKTTNGI